MADKSITNLRTGYGQVPDVRFSGPVMLDAFSKLAFRGATALKGKIQEEAVDQAKKDAAKTVLGLDPMAGAPLREGTDKETKAYNDEIKKGYLRRVELVARQKATELAAQNPADPQAIVRGAMSFASGAKMNMPPEMQPQLDLLMQTLISSSVSEATSKRLAIHEKAREADRKSLFSMRLTDAQRYSRAGDVVNLQHAFNSTAADLLSSVDPLTYPAEMAFKDLTAFRSAFVENVVKGAFDGTRSMAEKEAMLRKLARGELTVAVPRVAADGKSVEWATEPASTYLAGEHRDRALDYMKSALTADHTSIERDRADARYFGTLTVERDFEVLFTDADFNRRRAAADYIVANPFASTEDKARARTMLKDSVTDPVYYRNIDRQIALGAVASPSALDVDRLSIDDRKDLDARIKAYVRWSEEPVFKEAAKQIDLGVRDQAADSVVVLAVGSTAQQSKIQELRRTAGNRLELALRAEMQRRAMLGQTFGDNRSGHALEALPDGKIQFDPKAWVNEQLAAIQTRVGPKMQRLQELQKQMSAARLTGNFDMDMMAQIRDLRREVEEAFAAEITEAY